jgi:pimeloyl-ACP methyl ester carboxylesterase
VGAAAQAASNALWGDRVEAEHEVLAIPMAVRVGGADLTLSSPAVAAAFPRATPHVVVMVHGLVGDERWWHLRTRSGTGSYGDRLLRDHDLTPVVVRYNSGRHISENGRDLSALLECLVAAWPVPVASVSLVGHSMGGLVARSACHVGAESGADWTARTRVLVSLGTPHLGAPLERAAHVTDRALRLLPETEPFSRPLAARSAGIKDLRYGALVEEDWAGYDPDEFLRNRCTQVPLLPHITYYWVSSSLTHDPTHPVGRLLGDGLVLRASASGSHIGFDEASGVHVGAASHLHLMNHPEVYEQLAVWLEPPPTA